DYQGKKDKRFELVYQLYSTRTHQRLRLKTEVDENERVPTMTGIWKAADWPERECHEMFGIEFEVHPDLMRLLTIEEFDGFPLRKDYPLLGKAEIVAGHEGGLQWRKRE
ncbi:MAG TPA: NADH-quinone oxidoreductase subunit C, partial [Desulfobacterales bacterium]|nr:NADH-quinone oxidoreductase subunit C [Desulfobacterales bacterium]